MSEKSDYGKGKSTGHQLRTLYRERERLLSRIAELEHELVKAHEKNLLPLLRSLPEFNKGVEESPALAALVTKLNEEHEARVERMIAEEESGWNCKRCEKSDGGKPCESIRWKTSFMYCPDFRELEESDG